MAHDALRRVVRRESHSPRSAAAVVILVLVVLAAVSAGVVMVVQLLDTDSGYSAPGVALAWLEQVPLLPQVPAVAVGSLIAVVGIVLIWLALSPGRRPKHELVHASSSSAVLVDNAVVASSIAERTRRELDMPKGAVVVGIAHRSADVTVRPEPGQLIDRDTVRSIAEAELAEYELLPRVKVRARILRSADAKGAIQ